MVAHSGFITVARKVDAEWGPSTPGGTREDADENKLESMDVGDQQT